jgi:hypothetical protein
MEATPPTVITRAIAAIGKAALSGPKPHLGGLRGIGSRRFGSMGVGDGG